MNIESLKLKNYKGFEEISFQFNPQINVIIGNNGSGKTALLDAISIAASSFLRSIDGVQTVNIKHDDVRQKQINNGSVANTELQFPVSISSEGNFDNQHLSWTHSLNGTNSKTTIKDAKDIIDLGKELQNKVRNGDTEVILPIVSYYGTGRLWAIKKEKRDNSLPKSLSRFVGYVDCMDPKFSQKMMLSWLSRMAFLEYKENKLVPEFQAVKNAMEAAFSESNQYTQGKIIYDLKYAELMAAYVDSEGKTASIPFRLLSDGYRNTISMIGDIAYRMANLNPHLFGNVTTQTSGIIIIDEIDMFLHPQWQTHIIGTLIKIFPKIQFFVSTHSPSVIQNVNKANVILLDNCLQVDISCNTYGKDANTILEQIMGVDERPTPIKMEIKKIYTLSDEEKIDEAKLELEKRTELLGDAVSITELNTAIAFEEFTVEIDVDGTY